MGKDAPCVRISPDGFHKTACEIFACEYAQCFGLSTVVRRIFSLFGSRQRRLLAWEILAQLAGKSPARELQGTGCETRDFLHMDDLSRAILTLTPVVPRGQCTILNAASGRETPIMELAETMRAIIAPEKNRLPRNRAPRRSAPVGCGYPQVPFARPGMAAAGIFRRARRDHSPMENPRILVVGQSWIDGVWMKCSVKSNQCSERTHGSIFTAHCSLLDAIKSCLKMH